MKLNAKIFFKTTGKEIGAKPALSMNNLFYLNVLVFAFLHCISSRRKRKGDRWKIYWCNFLFLNPI